MVATQKKDFQNGRQKPFWKTYYVNIFCTSWPILMLKMSTRGVFRVLNRLERVLIWPEVRIMRNSKWPPFLLQQIIFFFIFLFMMLRGITLVRNMGLGHFFKWLPRKSNFGDISSSNWHRIIILVSIPIFSGSKNQMKPLIWIFGHSYMANSKKSKMATGENHFMTKSECLHWKQNWLTCYSNQDRYGYNA